MVTRRTVLNSLPAGSACGLPGGSQRLNAAQAAVRRFRIWDVHTHLHSAPGDTPEARMEVLIRCADRLGIERLILSQGYSADLHPTRINFARRTIASCAPCAAFPNAPTVLST